MSAITWYWVLLARVAAAGATYVACVWAHVRGVRGLALLVALLCLGGVATIFALLHMHQPPLTAAWLTAVERSLWWPMLLALLVATDLYAADHNGHRAITTMLYLRWERLRQRRG